MDSTSTSTSARRRGPLLRKSRAGCRDCRLRKVKVYICHQTKATNAPINTNAKSSVTRPSPSAQIVADDIYTSSVVSGAQMRLTMASTTPGVLLYTNSQGLQWYRAHQQALWMHIFLS
jgi:hypothetical protein